MAKRHSMPHRRDAEILVGDSQTSRFLLYIITTRMEKQDGGDGNRLIEPIRYAPKNLAIARMFLYNVNGILFCKPTQRGHRPTQEGGQYEEQMESGIATTGDSRRRSGAVLPFGATGAGG